MKNNYSLDFSLIPKELELLLDIMKVEDARNPLESKVLTEIKWDFFLELAIHHRIYPLIYTRLQKVEDIGIPTYIMQALYQEYKKNTFQMLSLCREIEHLSKLFTENQVRNLFLKGPVIAKEIYGDISLRTSKDLDILISKKDLTRVKKILLNNGYEKEVDLKSFGNWKWKEHHVTYFHPQKRVQVEIHWRLHPPPTKEPGFDELWKKRRASNLVGQPVYFLSEEDLFQYLIDHGTRHGWFRLRWLADIDQIIRKERTNIAMKDNSMLQALILTSNLFKTPINSEMQSLFKGEFPFRLARLAIEYIVEVGYIHVNSLKDHSMKYYNDKTDSIITKMHKTFSLNYYLFLTRSNLQRLIFVIELLCPNDQDMKILKLPKPFHFLYFPLRPFLWIIRNKRTSM